METHLPTPVYVNLLQITIKIWGVPNMFSSWGPLFEFATSQLLLSVDEIRRGVSPRVCESRVNRSIQHYSTMHVSRSLPTLTHLDLDRLKIGPVQPLSSQDWKCLVFSPKKGHSFGVLNHVYLRFSRIKHRNWTIPSGFPLPQSHFGRWGQLHGGCEGEGCRSKSWRPKTCET